MELLGDWVNYFKEAVFLPRPTDIVIDGKEKDFILKNGKDYYLFCYDLPMVADSNVALFKEGFYEDSFNLSENIISVNWLDDGKALDFSQNGQRVTIKTEPFDYGRNLVVRVAKIVCE